MDRERRPTVDKRGVASAVGELAGSQKQPVAPMSLAVNGLEYVGAAIAKAGNVLGALAAEKQEAVTRKQIGDADAAISVEKTKHESWKESTQADPLTWEERRAQNFADLRERTLSDSSLTRQAKELIATRFERENGLWKAEDELRATKRTFADVRDMTVANSRRHIDAQNRPAFDTELKAGGKYLSEIEKESLNSDFSKTGERIALKAKADELDAAESATITYAQGEGEASAIIYIDSLPFDAAKKEALKNVARRTSRTYDGEAQDFVLDGISTGDIKTGARIDQIAKDSPHLGVRAVESMKAYLAKKQTFEMQNDPASVAKSQAEISAMIRGYDRKDDADGMKALQIKQEIGLRLVGDSAGYLRQTLWGKFNDKPAKFTPSQETKAVLDDALNVLFDPVKGSMPWKRSEPVSVLHKTADDPWFWKPEYKAGDPIMDDKGNPKVAMDSDGRPKTKTVIDDTAKSRAVDAEQQIRVKFNEWARLNPGDARDPAKIRAQVLKDVPDAKKASLLDGLQKKLPVRASAFSPRGFEAADISGNLPVALRAHSQDYLDAAKEYGLNPRFLAAVSAFETSGGTSKAFREKNNAMGISDNDGPVALANVRESIFRQAKTLARGDGPYKNAKTVDEFGAIYAPVGAGNDPRGTNAGWAEGVKAWLARL